MSPSLARLAERLRLVRLAARLVAGRRFWIVPLVPLAWLGFQVLRWVMRWRPDDYLPADAQTLLIGVPLTVVATGLGVRIMAGEIDQRTLEIAYTVPGGTHRVWLAKLTAALLLLLSAEALLAAGTFLLCTPFPIGALYGALQSSVFYMVLAMALSTLTKSEATGALLTVGVLLVNLLVQGANLRISPFWNPAKLTAFDPADVLAWTVQNRIGFVLIIAAVTLLCFGRAERREKMLGG